MGKPFATNPHSVGYTLCWEFYGMYEMVHTSPTLHTPKFTLTK